MSRKSRINFDFSIILQHISFRADCSEMGAKKVTKDKAMKDGEGKN